MELGFSMIFGAIFMCSCLHPNVTAYLGAVGVVSLEGTHAGAVGAISLEAAVGAWGLFTAVP